jgi:hypothetical protein
MPKGSSRSEEDVRNVKKPKLNKKDDKEAFKKIEDELQDIKKSNSANYTLADSAARQCKGIKNSVDAMKDDMKAMKDDMALMQTDLKSLKQENSSLKKFVADLQKKNSSSKKTKAEKRKEVSADHKEIVQSMFLNSS